MAGLPLLSPHLGTNREKNSYLKCIKLEGRNSQRQFEVILELMYISNALILLTHTFIWLLVLQSPLLKELNFVAMDAINLNNFVEIV